MKTFKNVVTVGLLTVSIFAQQAHAALDASITTAIATGVTDAATLGGTILALIVGIAIFRHMRGAK